MDKANCIKARYEAGVTNFANDNSGVAIAIDEQYLTDLSIGGGGKPLNIVNTISSRYDAGVCKHKRERTGVAIPVLTPDRIEKRQNGRRFKENGEPMFTLTAQDRHGVGVEVIGNYSKSEHNASRIVSTDGIAPTVMENHGTVTAIAEKIDKPQRIGYCDRYNDGKPHQSTTFYDANYVSPTLDTCGGGNTEVKIAVPVKEATKQGYAECRVGGGGQYKSGFP